jgi:hypothetical protein
VVERGGLENRCGGDSTGGSNPSPSAKNLQLITQTFSNPHHSPFLKGHRRITQLKKITPTYKNISFKASLN